MLRVQGCGGGSAGLKRRFRSGKSPNGNTSITSRSLGSGTKRVDDRIPERKWYYCEGKEWIQSPRLRLQTRRPSALIAATRMTSKPPYAPVVGRGEANKEGEPEKSAPGVIKRSTRRPGHLSFLRHSGSRSRRKVGELPDVQGGFSGVACIVRSVQLLSSCSRRRGDHEWSPFWVFAERRFFPA